MRNEKIAITVSNRAKSLTIRAYKNALEVPYNKCFNNWLPVASSGLRNSYMLDMLFL